MVAVDGLVRRYGDFVAVDKLSLRVSRGEILGLLGPNGAGKTTAIRVIMGMFAPDEGSVTVLGRPPAETRAQVGYLPEERGLYRDLKVIDTLLYLAELKGLSRSQTRPRALEWLDRVELADRAEDRVKDLSRGMQQKVQFVAALVHDPDLLILDEPFQGLDPVNVVLIRDLIRELVDQRGKTVMLSAHEMSLVEALVDSIVLINRGRIVLAGPLEQIKREHAARTVRVKTAGDLPALPGVLKIERLSGAQVLTLDSATAPGTVLRALVEGGLEIDSYEVGTAPLEDIFVAMVKGDNGTNDNG
jgi:ABC-2 type transport system ATP-binding protein